MIDSSNPAAPGDSILIRITGQGAVEPALPSGVAAPPTSPVVPVLPVTATIGRVPARLISAAMSTTQAGVLDVWLEVPPLADDSYRASISVGTFSAGEIPVSVRSGQPPPRITAGGVVNSASFSQGVAPGSLFSIFGTGLGMAMQAAESVPLPTSLGGVSVTIGGRTAPLLYVSPGQINGQVPYEVTPGTDISVVVTVNGVTSPACNVTVFPAKAGIFQFGENRALVQNHNYSMNDVGNGAEVGEVITAYLTGSGQLDIPIATGTAAPLSPLLRVIADVTATVNGLPADVKFAGMTPYFIGLTQVNFEVPNLPPGTYPLEVWVNGVVSNSALVTVK